MHFSIGIYFDFVDCDAVPMDACSLLLVIPWEYDTDAKHHGRSNKYTFMHKGKKITLLPLTPAEIEQAEKDRAESAKNEPKDQQAIKLNAPVMLAIKSDLAEIHDDEAYCYALVCKDALFSIDDIASTFFLRL